MKYLTNYLTEGRYQIPSGVDVNVSYIEDIDEVRYWSKYTTIPSVGYLLMNNGLYSKLENIDDSNRRDVIGYVLDTSGKYSGKVIVTAFHASPLYRYGIVWSPSADLKIDIPGLNNYQYDNESEEIYKDVNGKSNTKIMVDYINSIGGTLSTHLPAVDYCVSYSPGFHDGEWYLPSMGELKLLFDNYNEFNHASYIVSMNDNGHPTNINPYDATTLWSSTEYSSNFQWAKGISKLVTDDAPSFPSQPEPKDYNEWSLPFLAID